MTFIDYRLCDICGNKTFYDADLNYDEPDANGRWHWIPDGVGAWAVICVACAATHEIKIVKKEKGDTP